MVNFVGRQRELRALVRACAATPGFAVVSGRRRVGKTALLDHFAAIFADRAGHDGRGGRAIFLPGTRAPVAEALRRLTERVIAVLPPAPGDLLDLGSLSSWDAALGYLLARSRDEPLLLVLDEFPYLCEADPSLPSTVQARWDHRGDAQLSVVLAGSHVGLMEQLLAADAPLFGRADAHLRLTPFDWRDVGLLVGGDDPDAWLEAFVTVGGMPRYLTLWDPRLDARTNLAELLDGPGAPLGDEGTVVQQELPPGSAPSRVLELVALGAETFTHIRDRAGLAPATTSEALQTLEALGLVDRQTPVGEDPRRTRRVRYQVRDPFLRLWLTIVGPRREAFELGRGEGVLTASAGVLADSHQRALAAVVRDWLADREQAECGPWWGADGRRVDALALRGAAVAAATARWAHGVDGAALTAATNEVLRGSPHERVDEVVAVARSGDAVVVPAELYDAGPPTAPG